MVQLPEQFRRQKLLRRQAAQNPDGHGSVERRRRSLAADVAQAETHARGAVAKEIVQVAAYFARRDDARGQIHAKIVRRHGPQQSALHALRGLQLALHAGFIARHLFVEARVFQRNRQLRRQDRKRLDVVFGEIVQLRALEIEHADDAPLDGPWESPARSASPDWS